jgi:imidazolonepropionase-like amidohydrolase
VSALLPLTPVGERPQRILRATLVYGDQRSPLSDAEVEVRGGRIVYAGPRRAAAISDADVIDAHGGFLMPGFVDAHVHLVMSDHEPDERQRTWFPEEGVIVALENLRNTLDAGVTTARDLSGLTPGYRARIATGQALGPRLHLAIAMLSPTGGHADPVLANGSLPHYAVTASTPGWALVDTPDEVVKTVRRLVRTGSDVIKVCTSGGVGSPHDSPSDVGIPLEHIELIVAEMRSRNEQPVAAHAQNDAGVRAAVLGGAGSVEHGYDLSDDTIDLLLTHGVTLVPTLSTLLRKSPPTEADAARLARKERQAKGLESIKRAIGAGVTVALGTDAGIHRHGNNLVELGHLVDAGLTPLQAIHAGTLAGARLLRLDHEIGDIREGLLADLVLTDVDPLAHIHELGEPGSIRLVMQGGRVVKDLDSRATRPSRL